MMIRNGILICIFFLRSLISIIAQPNSDSLSKILFATKDDTAKVNLLVKAGRAALYKPVKEFPYGDQVISISKKISYPIGLALGYRLNGSYYSEIKNNIPKGLKYYQMADSIYHLYSGPEYKTGLGAIQYCYGNIELCKGNNAEAAQFYIKALEILERVNDKPYLIRTYNNLANVYLFMNVLVKAEFYEKKCLKLLEEVNDLNSLPLANITMAAILIEQKKFKETLPYILKAQKMGMLSNNYNILFLSYGDLGLYYLDLVKDYKQAIHCNLMALEYGKKVDNPLVKTKLVNNLAYGYFKNNQFEKARITSQIA